MFYIHCQICQWCKQQKNMTTDPRFTPESAVPIQLFFGLKLHIFDASTTDSTNVNVHVVSRLNSDHNQYGLIYRYMVNQHPTCSLNFIQNRGGFASDHRCRAAIALNVLAAGSPHSSSQKPQKPLATTNVTPSS